MSAEGIAELLADFRLWLMDAAHAPDPPSQAPADAVDLFTLVSQFTALRQEVNLQTKAVRGQQEQSNETLRQNTELFQALQKMQQELAERSEASRRQELEAAVRPLLQALVDVADSQMLAARELARTVQIVSELLRKPGIRQQEQCELPPAPSSGLLGKLFGIQRLLSYQRELAAHFESQRDADVLAQPAASEVGQIGRILESALAGLTMGLQRIERAMRQFDLEPIQVIGQPFDPERMEAVEVIVSSGRPAGEVVDELRRGYSWKEKVFRFAQVRVAR